MTSSQEVAFTRRMLELGSAERAQHFLSLHKQFYMRRDGIPGPVAGRAFWLLIAQEWSGFDAIPHCRYQRAFLRWRSWWSVKHLPSEDRAMYIALPDTQITAYRGQSADCRVGLSWTLDLATASAFARGHRSPNRNPTVYRAHIDKKDIALVFTDRKEAEIVLFQPPKSWPKSDVTART